MNRQLRVVTLCLLIAALVACGRTDSRERNASVLAGTSCKKAGQAVSPNGIRHVCGKTPIGNIWYVTTRSTGKVAMCKTLGKIRFKSKVVWVCGLSKGSGQWFATKPLPVVASGVSTTIQPTPLAPPSTAGASDAFASEFTPSTVSPSTTSVMPPAPTTALPAGGYTTTQDAPAEPDTKVLAEPKDDPLPGPRVADLTGPTIEAITVSPKDVTPGDHFKVRISASDPAGIASVAMSFRLGVAQRDFCGQALKLVTGDSFSSTWEVECTAPSIGSNGQYDVVPYARDLLDNYTNYNCCSLSDLRGSFTLSGAKEDSDGPSFSNLLLNKKNLVPGDTVTLSVDAMDASGIDWVQFAIKLGDQQFDFCGGTMTRASGTTRSGRWTSTCTLPAIVRNGTYSVKLYGADTAENYTNTNCCSTSLVTDTFNVSSGTDDASGPDISSISISQSPVRPGDTIRITVVATDASGVSWAGFSSSINGAQRDICGQSLTKQSTRLNASTWQTDCEIPITAQPGTYEFRAYASDPVGNNTNFNCCDLSALRAYLDVE